MDFGTCRRRDLKSWRPTRACQSTRSLPDPETRSPKTKNRKSNPEIRPKPEARNRNPKTENRKSKPETRHPKTETRNPKPETRNPGSGCEFLVCAIFARLRWRQVTYPVQGDESVNRSNWNPLPSTISLDLAKLCISDKINPRGPS